MIRHSTHSTLCSPLSKLFSTFPFERKTRSWIVQRDNDMCGEIPHRVTEGLFKSRGLCVPGDLTT